MGYNPGGEEFIHLFEQTFPGVPKPKFRVGTIENAIEEASIANKPILIYIHNTQDITMLRYFIQNTIGNPDAVKIIVNLILYINL